ncbi:MAG: hypothetical protein HY363_01575 [Candidatus Aenigmarchaeota archaeon]|nr:hypothetical protein [Candidatus Aenigmarchaeota archaeon]
MLEKIVKKARAMLAGISLAASMGCASLGNDNRERLVMGLIPVNAAAGYFGAVATHEGGHALTAAALGSEHVDVDVLPSRMNGNFYYGRTSADTSQYSETDRSLFNTSGPAINLVAQVISREALKTGSVPAVLQPTLQWYALANKVAFYSNVIRGLERNDAADLGKEDLWVSLVFLTAGLSYDIYDLLSDSPSRYFGVLFGVRFYEPQEERMHLEFSAGRERNYIGMRIEW